MSTESVRAHFESLGLDLPIIEHAQSTATVALAAQAFGVAPGQIAKTLAFRLASGQAVLVVARGDVRVDNTKLKNALGKGKMLSHDEVTALTGHPVGGVCPFGLAQPLLGCLDVSLQAFHEVLPAAGSVNSALRISPARMAELTGGRWVDVCQPPQVQPDGAL